MNLERLYKVLLGPVISEKSAVVADKGNQVVFKVVKTATKPEIKAAVEKLFNVNVRDVRVLNVKGKTKRTRFGLGQRSDWKKAYVRLEQGQEIDFAIAE
ncbi:50S ribosomal protein L23 [Saccharophagus degradans]|uniref:Large ribosomal subunit protein uL23 n=2 Tax=Saccharophagus degradans TaxID=86304 RepID=RL23_SACD2|nr:50S ribosomal protein L23 [Saccharophagus degradans]Q21M55.1 RecName: Full=Large ribosomal subunit protein uL23; AltName: Full=50S ribosomal protein L23 [Saccharophagus degradans 2-40]ABD80224.1 LSU ribosomal protein L23P [Saccharophagus degradans 2-40]MBU2987512.1 50S ribosomal protein L23 [Saccharophagus degradans]MDO6424077.1 50S ribosomal protein L23 [Saccharophagus degradans]MDO6609446.1 50S ribosomal protein L23 [Saccharophagus degradans]WGO97603.1 50S ribosomal protein L23 [Saccharo